MRHLFRVVLWTGLLLVGLSSLAQAAYYVHAPTTFSWIPTTGSTAAIWTGAGTGKTQCKGGSAAIDDDITAPIPLGFSFNFGGTVYTSARIMSNGRLQFNNTFCGYGTQRIGPPQRTYPYPYANTNLMRTLRVYGNDLDPKLDPKTGGSVRYATLGSGTQHRFVVTFTRVPEWSGTNNAKGSYFNLQIILYENGDFVYQFGPSNNPSGGKAQIGWELTPSDYGLVSFSSIGALTHHAIRFYTATPTAPLAYYAMDATRWNGTPGEVIDGSGNGHNGVALGKAQTTPNGKRCYGAKIPKHTKTSKTNTINTGINVKTSIGSQGSIDFWYKSRAKKQSGKDMILFDASTANGNNYNSFFMDLYYGSLGFRIQDNNGNYATILTPRYSVQRNTWVYIAATWDVPNNRMQLYINGSLAGSAPLNFSGPLSNTGPLYLGDNSTRGAAPYYGLPLESADGTLDEVRLYKGVISQAQITNDMNATHPCGALFINHFKIIHSDSGLSCTPATLTLLACADTNPACTNRHAGQVTVTLSPTGPSTHWGGGNPHTFTGGQTTLSLHQTTPATLTLGVLKSTPGASKPLQCLDTTTGSTSCAITFHDSGFVYTIPSPQVAAITTPAITVSAVRKGNTAQQCVPAFANRTANIDFWSAYVSPVTGTLPLTLNNGTGNYTLTTTGPGTSVPITFDAQGQSKITLNYPDAGQLTLNSLFTGSGQEAGLTMTGSATWASVPARLDVFSPAANAPCNPASPSCSKFAKAGQAFPLTVRALNANNAVTPNFQDTAIALSTSLIAPAGGSPGTLGVTTMAIGPADQGTHTLTNQSIFEVGVFTITATDKTYLSAFIGTAAYPGYPAGTSANVGRFYPAHFCASSPLLSNRTDPNTRPGSAAGFTYLGEFFTSSVVLTAQPLGALCSSSASVTRNYAGVWSKFSSPFSEKYTVANEPGKWNYAAVNATATPLDLSGRLHHDANNCIPVNGLFSNGSISLSCRLKVSRLGSAPGYTPEAPLLAVHLGINPVDTDGVALLPGALNLTIGANKYADVGHTTLYFGRLFADNAYGSQLLPLAMWARTQYCASASAGVCTAWVNNDADSHSLYAVAPPPGTALGNAAPGDGAGYYLRPNPATKPDAFDYTGTAKADIYLPDTQQHAAGWRLWYTGGGAGGNYQVPLVGPPYLLLQPGTASFGQYRGDDRIIYWRENNQ